MKTQFGKIVRESKACVLCSSREATTKEHIPPRGLFTKKPREYLAVPSCDECNHSTKLDDEYLQQTMSGASLVGQGRMVWKNKVAPKFKDFPKTQAGLRNITSVRKLDINGIGKMNMPVMELDAKRINTSIRKMVFGLYWFHTNLLLESSTTVNTYFFNAVEAPKFLKGTIGTTLSRQTAMGVYTDPEVVDTFFYTVAISDTSSLWFFSFYKQNLIIATT